MSVSQVDAVHLLLSLLPPGELGPGLLDPRPTGDPYLYFDGIAALLKEEGYDVLDLLRLEIFPQTATLKLPEWETLFGLSESATAKNGSVAQRRGQIISRMREPGSSAIPILRAILEPLLGYAGANVGTLEILETSRAALTAAHTYAFTPGDQTIPANGTTNKTTFVPDDAKVSRGGAFVTLAITHPNVEELRIGLLAPDLAHSHVWDPETWTRQTGAVNQTYTLWAPDLAGLAIGGTWKLSVQDHLGAATGTLGEASVFIEGIGRDSKGYDGLGAIIFEWCVRVDPAKVVEPQYDAARAAIKRIQQAHTNGALVFRMSSGSGCAEYDDTYATYDGCVYC